MKLIKVILGFIIALTLVFFATGLIVKEVNYTTKVVIDKPLDDVFSNFDSPKAQQQWMTEIKSIEVINKNPQKIGSIYKLIVAQQNQETAVKQKILAYIKNEKITFQFTTDGFIKVDDYIFEKENNFIKVVQHSTIRSNSFMLACTYPWFKYKFIAMSQVYLDKLKHITENK